MGAKLVKDWKYMHMPLKFLASLACLDPVPCCPNPVSYTCNLHQPPPATHCEVVNRCSQRTLAPLLYSLLLTRFLCVLCAGDEKLRGWVPAPPTSGLPIYPLWTHEELLVTRSDEAASFSGNPGTAATFHLKSPAPPACSRLWSQVSRLSPEEEGLTGTLHLAVTSRRRGSVSNADWEDAPWVLCVQKIVVISLSPEVAEGRAIGLPWPHCAESRLVGSALAEGACFPFGYCLLVQSISGGCLANKGFLCL